MTLVLPDPVKGMGALRRRRTRMTRPIRRRLEIMHRGVQVRLVEDVNDPCFIRHVPAGSHGLITAYPQIFRRPAIDRFDSLVNVHPSLLPYYRGPDPFYWLEINGEDRSGYTLHHVTEEIDAGPIIFQEVVSIAGGNAFETVIAAAVPTVQVWLRHLVAAEPFETATVDAASVYKVRQDYGPLLAHRRRGPTWRRVRVGRWSLPPRLVPRRLRALIDLTAMLRSGGQNLAHQPLLSDWDAVLDVADQERVTSWLWCTLGEHARHLPAEAAERLATAHRANGYRNMRLRRQLLDALAVLADVGIVPLVLKGGLTLLQPSQLGIGARRFSDLDLAVLPEQFGSARAALEAAGYRSTGSRPHGTPHELALHHSGALAPLELHHDLGAARLTRVLPLAEAWRDSSEFTVGSSSARRLSWTHAALHSVLHAEVQDLNHAVAGIALRAFLDLQQTVRTHGADIHWVAVHNRMSQHGLDGVLRDHLWLAHRLLGVEVPECISPGFGMRWYEARSLISFSLGWPAHLQRNLRETLDAEYLDHLYSHGGDRWKLTGARWRHLIGLGLRDPSGKIRQAFARQE